MRATGNLKVKYVKTAARRLTSFLPFRKASFLLGQMAEGNADGQPFAEVAGSSHFRSVLGGADPAVTDAPPARGRIVTGLDRARRLFNYLRFGAVFEPARPNNLDLVRFIAASLVLVDHSYALTGRPGHAGPFHYETWGGFAVAIFFVISGFLVAASWQREPGIAAFARKRALRIVPAFAIVVAVCALLLGPVLTTIAPGAYFRSAETWGYFRSVSFLKIYYTLPGVFASNPYPNAVNGSIWTLPIEVAMYVLLATLGALRSLNRATVTVLVLALAVAWFGWGVQLWGAPPLWLDVLPAAYTVHLALWFFIGAAYWLWRDRIYYRVDAAIALGVLCWLTDSTVVGSILFHAALPYMLLTFATMDVRWMARFGARGDFSYGMYLYAFPVQQTFVSLGGASWPLPPFMAACFAVTLGCAFASWHVVESPALRRKKPRAKIAPS
jgi:peptidoglycan/LPS O-acetylase OafA/YrhL